MNKKDLFMSWLVVKVAVVGLLFILLGFNYVFSADFWYDGKFETLDAQKAISTAGNVDQFDQRGYTALMLSSAAGKVGPVELLIKNGANVNLNADNAIGDTALHFACKNINLGSLDVIDVLLKNNANPLLKSKKKITPFGLLSGTILPENFERALNMFIAKGVDINYPDDLGNSLLFASVDRMQIVLLDLLQKKYAHLIDFDLKNKNGKNIFQFAVGKGDIASNIKPVYLARLSPAINVNSYDARHSLSQDFTYVIAAAVKGRDDYLKEAIERNGANLNLPDKIIGGTCLHWACLYNRLKCIEVILGVGANASDRNKADTNYKNKFGQTPIHCLWAVRGADDRKKAAKLLSDFGANFNAQDENGNTFLHNAVIWADVDFVKLIATDDFFSRRVNFSLKNKKNKTAYATAYDLKNDPKYKDIIELLKNYTNASYVSSKDQEAGITALMLACMRGDQIAAKQLISASTVNKKDKNNDTPLHFAIRSKNTDIAKMLISAGAKVGEKNNLGNTPLNEVVNIIDKKEIQEIAKLLLEKGCGISDNNNGENIMHLAVRRNMPDLIMFLKQNLGRSEKNKDGKTAYDLAKEIGQKQDMKEVINALDGVKK